MITSKDKQTIRDGIHADHVIFKKDGTVVFKDSYFYHHGRTGSKFAARVVRDLTALLFDVQVVDASDNWAAWPRTSYLVVQVRVSRTSLLSPRRGLRERNEARSRGTASRCAAPLHRSNRRAR